MDRNRRKVLGLLAGVTAAALPLPSLGKCRTSPKPASSRFVPYPYQERFIAMLDEGSGCNVTVVATRVTRGPVSDLLDEVRIHSAMLES